MSGMPRIDPVANAPVVHWMRDLFSMRARLIWFRQRQFKPSPIGDIQIFIKSGNCGLLGRSRRDPTTE
jgi:hypothetical protein